ncbi:MAG: DUF5806 family protein [Halobacteriales archaeon]
MEPGESALRDEAHGTEPDVEDEPEKGYARQEAARPEDSGHLESTPRGFVEPEASLLSLEDDVEDDGADVPERVRKYDRFQKIDTARYERVNDFLRKRTYITAREWAIARLCADFRTETGVEMTLIGDNLPELVPFMEDTYSPQAVNQARSAFEDKVRMAGSTFLYGAMSGFFTTEELDEMMYEVSETARFLLEVEGAEVGVEHETDVEDRIGDAMRDIRESSQRLRVEEGDHEECPHCGREL